MGEPPRPIGGSHAVGGALAQAQASGGIAAAVVAVIGRPLPTLSGEFMKCSQSYIIENKTKNRRSDPCK